MSSVLLSHPHVGAVAHGFAASLERAGKLAGFTTGMAFDSGSWAGTLAAKLAVRRPVLRNRILTDIPRSRLLSLPFIELASRGAGWALGQLGAPVTTYDAIFAAHDAAVASMPWPLGTTDVYAYEDAALRTFRRAQRADIGRIWDLPLPHYSAIEELYRLETARWPEAFEGHYRREAGWKRNRKDAEMQLATKISVASVFTMRSLERFDIRKPVVIVPYGFPTESFSPRRRAPQGKFTVLSVGTHDLRKGTPYLLEAWRLAGLEGAELHLVGPLRLAKVFMDRYAGLFRHWPHVPKAQLNSRYAEADVLVFPTLGDGFGLVIQEAMCAATPVVTTHCGGGPECITDGVDGWLIPPRNIDALVERLRAAATDRDQLVAVGAAARARAERWTWHDAEDMLVSALTS